MMAITVIIEPTVDAVSGLETRFTASGPFVLYGDGFVEGERCSLERLGPSGTYIKARSKKGMIKVGAYPNMVYVDAPGSYQLVKSATRTAASVGIQSQHTLELLINTDEYPELKMTEIFGRPDTTGIWYDPQDLTTLYQDAQGTLPVYRPGTGLVDPPVGLMLDKSQGLELGPELWDGVLLVANSTSGANGVYDAETGELRNTVVGTLSYVPSFLGNTAILELNKFYRVRLKFSGNLDPLFSVTLHRTAATTAFNTGGISGNTIRSAGGEIEYIGTNQLGNPSLRINTDGRTTWGGLFIESISIREIKGYHAYQSTTTARPTLSGRYNLLTATETLSTQNVTTVYTDYTLRFEGAGSITLSGTATGTLTAGTHTITCTAGTLTCTVDGSVTKADLRVKRDGSKLPAYQAVVDADNYDTDGFPLYLRRDMVDDNMLCQAPEGGITGTFSIGTIDGPVFGTRKLPAGEAYPLWNDRPAHGPSTYTQLINFNTVLGSDDQEVFERFVYSRAKQLIDVDQFGGVSSFFNFFRSSVNHDTSLLTINVSNFDTRNVSSFERMFYNNHALVISNIDALDVTSKAINLNTVFSANRKLTAIDISGWDLSKMTNASHLFSGCNELTSVTVGTAFDNTPCTAFLNAFANTNLNQASIDKILISINKAGTSNGTFAQSGGSAPSAAGEAAITAMRSRGWTIIVTGGF